ncbi:hypothetical protein [Mesorhizobium kowhaii]
MDILTRSMAAELGPVGIRTAAVAADYIRTPCPCSVGEGRPH